MKPTYKNAFLTGYLSNQAGTYFNQVLLIEPLEKNPDPAIKEEYVRLAGRIGESGQIYVDNIKQAERMAKEFGISTPELPRFPKQYETWAKAMHKGMMQKFGEETRERYLFCFGSHLGDLTTTLYLLDNTIYLIGKIESEIYSGQLVELIEDLRQLKPLFSGCAFILDNEESTRFMWEDWKMIDEKIDNLLTLASTHNHKNDPSPLQDSIEHLLEVCGECSRNIQSNL